MKSLFTISLLLVSIFSMKNEIESVSSSEDDPALNSSQNGSNEDKEVSQKNSEESSVESAFSDKEKEQPLEFEDSLEVLGKMIKSITKENYRLDKENRNNKGLIHSYYSHDTHAFNLKYTQSKYDNVLEVFQCKRTIRNIHINEFYKSEIQSQLPVFLELFYRSGIDTSLNLDKTNQQTIYVNTIQKLKHTLNQIKNEHIQIFENFSTVENKITTHLEIYSYESLVASINIDVKTNGKIELHDEEDTRVYLNIKIVTSKKNQKEEKIFEMDALTYNKNHFNQVMSNIKKFLDIENYCNNTVDINTVIEDIVKTSFSGINHNLTEYNESTGSLDFILEFEFQKILCSVKYIDHEVFGTLGHYLLNVGGKQIEFKRMSSNDLKKKLNGVFSNLFKSIYQKIIEMFKEEFNNINAEEYNRSVGEELVKGGLYGIVHTPYGYGYKFTQDGKLMFKLLYTEKKNNIELLFASGGQTSLEVFPKIKYNEEIEREFLHTAIKSKLARDELDKESELEEEAIQEII